MTASRLDIPGRRIPVRLHRGVGLILTDDAYLATELITSPKSAPYIAGRLTDRALLIAQDAAPALIKALKQTGYPVLIVSKLLNAPLRQHGYHHAQARMKLKIPAKSFRGRQILQLFLAYPGCPKNFNQKSYCHLLLGNL